MLRARNLVPALLPCVFVSAVAASGADPAEALPKGALVRVTAPSLKGKRFTGTLAGATGEEIVLSLSDSERKAIPRSAVTRLEWSPRHHRHPIPGAVVGGLLGGVFLGAASVALCDAASCSVSMAAVGVGFALGALPGAGIGALIKTREWTDVEPSRVRVSIAPVRGRGAAVKLTVRF